MAKTKVSEWDSTPGNNTDIDSINIAEGCAPSGINNAIRELMSQVKDYQQGTYGDTFNGPVNGTIGATTPAAGAFTTLSASSTATLNTLASSGATLTGGSINNMAIGGSTAAAGAFTTLSASGAVTLSGGTANSVAYLNGSKVLTTGSALTFDGTDIFSIGGGSGTIKLGTNAVSQLTINNNFGTSLVTFNNTYAAGGYVYQLAGSEQMRLTSTGLGIGTSSPGAKLSVELGHMNMTTDYGARWRVSGGGAYNGAMLFDSGNNWIVQLGSSLTEAMRLTSTGLGIGTTSPAAKLNVNGSALFNGTTKITSNAVEIQGDMTLGNYAAYSTSNYRDILYSASTSSYGNQPTAFIRFQTVSDVGSAICFATRSSPGDYAERARIDSSGRLLVNATSTAEDAKIQLGGTSSTMRFIPTVDNTGYVGQSTYRWAAIYAANGTIQTSDGREKNTIENSVLGLDFVKALRPVSFKWNVGENVVTYDDAGNQVITPRAGTRTHFGFIAQEVKEVLGTQDFGGYVEEQDGRLGLRYDQFISPLVKAIQEQQVMIQALTDRISALEAK